MSFWKKLLGGDDDESSVEEAPQEVELSVADLKAQVNNSLKRVNDLGEEDYAKSVINELARVKSIINGLMSRELGDEYNKALLIGANNARKRINDQLSPLLDIKEPEDLVGVNAFIKDVEKLLVRASEVSSQSMHAQVIFRDDMNRLSSAFDDLNDELGSLKEAVAERNEQLDSFNRLVKEVKAYQDSLMVLDDIKDEEFKFRKRISSYERDKAFLTGEVARIKSVETFNNLINVKADLKAISKRKLELEGLASNIVSKFSRVLRKVFRKDDFVTEFLANPLEFISKKEGVFNKQMSQLVTEINSGKLKLKAKDKARYLKAISDDRINDYINEYKALLNKERRYDGNDFSLLQRAEAFERRLLELNKQVNKDVKDLDSFSERIASQEREIEALKAKLESVASDCYSEIVRLV